MNTDIGTAPKSSSIGEGTAIDNLFHTDAVSVGVALVDEGVLLQIDGLHDHLFVFFPHGNMDHITDRSINALQNAIVVDGGALGSTAECIPYLTQNSLVLMVKQVELKVRIARLTGEPVEALDRINVESPHAMELSHGPGRTLWTLASILYDALKSNTTVETSVTTRHISEALIYFLLEAVPHRFTPDVRRNPSGALPRYVKHALNYMRANLSRPITVAEVAKTAGVSVRTLHQGFRTFMAVSPMNFLKGLRLDAARRELLATSSSLSVSDIATRCGLSHLGRFPTEYYKRFGEYPSTTMRERR